MNYLIITSAHSDNSRNLDYKNSLNDTLKFKHYFDKIYILECVSKNIYDLDYLKSDDVEIIISEFDNSYVGNYGINEFTHINTFISNSKITDDDYIIKLTGRYTITNDKLLSLIPTKYDVIAKYDGDVWDSITGNNNKGVHTFYFIFKKFIMNDFIKYLHDTNNINKTTHIEWLFKNYIETQNNSLFYSGEMGVFTNFKNPPTSGNLMV
jgi:hypothetical protein